MHTIVSTPVHIEMALVRLVTYDGFEVPLTEAFVRRHLDNGSTARESEELRRGERGKEGNLGEYLRVLSR